LKLIVVGAGGISRDLVRRLAERWAVTVIDGCPESLKKIGAVRELVAIEGDGSSRLVLDKAGVDSADALIAATGDDDVNLEVCRLAVEAGVQRIAAICVESERQGEYRERSLPVIAPDCLAGRRLDLQLETRRIASMAFADGKAEAIEFLVADDSPVRGKSLMELHSHTWILGALLRDGELIIPHGETRLAAGDRVTVVGASADFAQIVNTFTAGMGRFPEDFGQKVGVAVDRPTDVETVFSEAIYLARNSTATSVVLLHRDQNSIHDADQSSNAAALLVKALDSTEGMALSPRPVAGDPSSFLPRLAMEESIGLLAVPAPDKGGIAGWWQGSRALRLMKRTCKPVLLARGNHPYRRIVLPVRTTTAGKLAARTAIDLARSAQVALHGIAVVDPVFNAGPDAEEEARSNLTWLEDEAAVQDVHVEDSIVHGNPVRAFLENAQEGDLLVLAVRSEGWRPWPRLRIGPLLARLSKVSVLLVPTRNPD